jgi:hypothetical protein
MLARPRFLSGVGDVQAGASSSLEALVIDDDILGDAFYALTPRPWDDEALDVAAIIEGVLGGKGFLATKHTRRYIRSEFVSPRLRRRGGGRRTGERGSGRSGSGATITQALPASPANASPSCSRASRWVCPPIQWPAMCAQIDACARELGLSEWPDPRRLLEAAAHDADRTIGARRRLRAPPPVELGPRKEPGRWRSPSSTSAPSGSYREIGRQVGEAARPQIEASLAFFADNFAAMSGGLSFGEAAAAGRRLPALRARLHPQAVEELEGMAEGAGVPFDAPCSCPTAPRSSPPASRSSASRPAARRAGRPPADRLAPGCTAVAIVLSAAGTSSVTTWTGMSSMRPTTCSST